jgi:threonine/homoserine/homoserine lactone efflux protein
MAMLGIHDYWLFVMAGVLLNLTPGQDTFYILGRSIAQGTRAGVASAIGITAGSLIHTFAAAIGLSAILATSVVAFTVLKLVGAAYLIYIGARMLFAVPTAIGMSVPEFRTETHARETAVSAFRQGVVTNVLNPKVGLFFLAFMPQFIAADSTNKVAAFIALGLTFVTTGTVWCLVLALAAGKLRSLFVSRPSAATLLSRAAGVMFVGLGVRLATERSA